MKTSHQIIVTISNSLVVEDYVRKPDDLAEKRFLVLSCNQNICNQNICMVCTMHFWLRIPANISTAQKQQLKTPGHIDILHTKKTKQKQH